MRGCASASVNGAPDARGPIKHSPKSISVVDSVGAIAFLVGVAVQGVGTFDVQDMTGQSPCTYKLADVGFDLPNGPVINVFCIGGVIVHIAAGSCPFRSRCSLDEIEVDFKLSIAVVDVANNPLKSSNIFRVNRPGQSIFSFIEVVGRGEASGGEFSNLETA
ncbi:hypothetical protein OA144_00225 [bacterium]|nr:hypothetical protein [bacterium]